MEIAELEGYLVALIAWPVGISSGAWLPRIWGHPGWKVPTKIAARSQYEEFVAMIVGFMQDLDRELSRQPARFESSVLRGLREREHTESLHGWGRGFMTALTLGSQGLRGAGQRWRRCPHYRHQYSLVRPVPFAHSCRYRERCDLAHWTASFARASGSLG